MSCFRRLFITMCILWISCLAYAQSLPDSVDAALKPLQGAEKLKAIPGCMMALYQHTPPYLEKLLELGNEGILLAQQLGDQRRQAIINLHMARGYYHAGIYDKRPQDYLKTAITRCEQTGNTNGAGVCNMYLGDIYLAANNYNQAANCYQKAVTLMNSDAQEYLKKTYINLSACYTNIGNYDNALECCSKALDYAWKLKDKQSQARVYNNIGNIYETQCNYDLALLYYQRCLDNIPLSENKSEIAASYNNIGNMYKTTKQNQAALKYYKKALALWKRLKNRNEEAGTLNNIGLVYKQQDNYNAAVKYYEKALKIFTELGNTKKITAVSSNIASVAAAMKSTEESLAKFDSILGNAEKQNDPVNLKTIYLNLSELYEAQNNPDKALEYARKYGSLLLNLHNIDTKNLAVLEKKLKNREGQLKEAEVRQKRSLASTIITVLILVIIIGILLHIASRYKLLHRLADMKNKLYRGVMGPYFIYNSMTAIQANILKGETDIASVYLSELARIMRDILENVEKEYVSIEKEVAILRKYLEMQRDRQRKAFDYDIRICPSVDAHATGMPPMLLQPLVENAIQHGLAGSNGEGFVLVEIRRENDMLICEVSDNGIGINRHLEMIQTGQDGEHGSYSLKLINKRFELMAKQTGKKPRMEIVDMKTVNKNTHGTLVTLKIPVKELY